MICVLGGIDSKNEERELSKADKETKRKANSFKRDPLTQTKLQCFFKKASDKSPSSTPGQSEDDDGVVGDENGSSNYDDTTLKLEEPDNLDNNNHDDTTLKIDEESDNDDKNDDHNRNTFVINITLQGVPKKENKFENSEEKHKNDINKDILSPNKINPTAKRKLHDLFGESSDSEEEVTGSKKAKLDTNSGKDNKDKSSLQESKSKIDRKESKRSKSDHKDTEKGKKESPEVKKNRTQQHDGKKLKKEHDESKKHRTDAEKKKEKKEHETKRRKSSESKHCSKKSQEKDTTHKSDNSKNQKDVTKKTVFGELTDSDSEKELVIDDGTESHSNINEAEEATSNKTSHSSNDNIISLVVVDTDDAQQNNLSNETNAAPPLEVDDSKLDKAMKLSREADKVLEALKQFSEMPPEPIVVEKPTIEAKPPLNEPIVASQSPSKHKKVDKKSKLSLKTKSKERHNSSDKNKPKKSEKVKVEKKKIKEEVVAKKTEKVDVAGLVVKSLMPYYKSKQINSRDLFKITARHIVHQLLAIQVTGKFTSIEVVNN